MSFVVTTRTFDLSVVYPQAFPNSPSDQIVDDLRLIHSLGAFSAVELTHIEDHAIRIQVTEQLKEYGWRVIFLAGLPSFKAKAFLNADGAERTRAVDFTKSLIEEASTLGADSLLVVSGPDSSPLERSASIGRLTQSLRQVCAFTRENFPQMEIRLEHTDRDMHRKQLIGPTSESLRIIHELELVGETLRLNLDLSHILQLHEDVRHTLEITQSHCNHFHFSNCIIDDSKNPLFGDHHPQFGHTNSEVGLAELTATWRDLDSLGYLTQNHDTVLGIEVVPAQGEDPRRTLSDALSFIQATQASALH